MDERKYKISRACGLITKKNAPWEFLTYYTDKGCGSKCSSLGIRRFLFMSI
jgi:hypothetical protein